MKIGDKIEYICAEKVSANDLNILYNFAHAFIYPSSYEGFGIPIIEAMKAGCPVITTKVSSIPEIAGDSVLYLDNISASEIVNKILDYENLEFRNTKISKGIENSKNFSWDICYNNVVKVYDELL
ncbi:MAG: glycosyltransferase [Fusobacteriaceae bacterium]